MLYDSASIFLYGFYVASSPPILADAAIGTIRASSGQYTCAGTSDDQCIIYCDVKEDEKVSREFDCGNVSNCQFECDEKKCIGIGGTVNARNAQNLDVSSNADDCMHGATVYTPSLGNASFVINGILNGFAQMNVESGTNTQNIQIDCYSSKEEKEDCKGMTVNAQNADHLSITIASAIYDTGTIHCPYRNANSNTIPCILAVKFGGTLRNVQITAKDGLPANVWIDDQGGTIDWSTITIHCDNGTSTGPFTSSSTCWNTMQPTTSVTASPTNRLVTTSTVLPTATSTTQPTTTSTDIPTAYPSWESTASPTSSYPTSLSIGYLDIGTSSFAHSDEPMDLPSVQQGLSLNMIAVIALSSLVFCILCCLIVGCVLHQKYRQLKTEMTYVGEESNSDLDKIVKEDDKRDVLQWLSSIGSKEYYPLFMEGGFDSMTSIQCIEDREVLKEIGIEKTGHQMLLLSEIAVFKMRRTDYATNTVISASAGERTLSIPNGLPPLPPQQLSHQADCTDEGDQEQDVVTVGFIE